MIEVKDLVEISKFAGERFDLVQAGGGNSSAKFDNGEMIIKASGFLLSDVNENSGFSKVATKQIVDIVKNSEIINTKDKRKRESLTSTLVKEATIDRTNRPSIETLLHAFLLKYTLHTHPVVVNIVVVQKNWKKVLSAIFKDEKIALVDYQTPGIELALALDKELQNYNEIPKIIFLQNHGLIVTSENKEDIIKLTDYVIEKVESYLNINMDHFKLNNKISSLFNSIKISSDISYLSEDKYLNDQIIKNKTIFFNTPFCPDSLVYCGISCCELKDLNDIKSLQKYQEKYFESPKVIIFSDKLFFRALNSKKAKEMEEVFKFHIMVLEKTNLIEKNFLSIDELSYLSNWEAEKYRQKK